MRNHLIVAASIVLAAASSARAAYTFTAFNNAAVTSTWTSLNTDSIGTIPAGQYSSATVTANWTSVSGSPFSSEARVGFSSRVASGTTTTPTYGAGNTVYVAPVGATTGFASSGAAATLTWNVPFTALLTSDGSTPNDLFFNYRQTFSGSTANWQNVTVTLNDFVPPTGTPLAVPGTASRARSAGQIHWYSFNITSANTYIIDTVGTTLSASSFGDLNDTEIGLYNSAGTLVGNNDDATAPSTISPLSRLSVALTPGTYYLAASAYDTTFGASLFGASTTPLLSAQTGTLVVNITPIPEPATLALVAAGVPVALRRVRRRAR